MKETSSLSRLLLGVTVLAVLALFSACSPDITETEFYSRHPVAQPEDDLGPTLIGERSIEGQIISLWKTDPVHVGYNRLLVRVEDSSSGSAISDATITVLSSSKDGDSIIEGPTIDVPTKTNADGEVTTAVLFLEPPGTDELWDVHVSVEYGTVTRAVLFEVDPEESVWSQYISSGEYYVVWLDPLEPETGDAALEFAIYQASSNRFTAVDGVSIDLYPYMDMGGGDGHSTPYVAPERVDTGRYRGRINFIMAGGWDLTVYLRFPDQSSNEVVFKGFTVK